MRITPEIAQVLVRVLVDHPFAAAGVVPDDAWAAFMHDLHATAANRKTVTIATPHGPKEVPVNPVDWYGQYVVHGDRDGRIVTGTVWTVTHAASGMAVCTGTSFDRASALAAYLYAHAPDAGVGEPLGKPSEATIQQLRDVYAAFKAAPRP